MGHKRVEDRQRAIERYRQGECPASICAGMGYSRRWLYKWLKRASSSAPEWASDRSRRPHGHARRLGPEIEQIVTLVRLSLYNRGLFCGAQAIRWELEDLRVAPLPSLRTINRVLVRLELTQRRTARYQPKGTPYPGLVSTRPGDVHQTDFVGPCYLRGPLRFYSLHSVDVVTGRCAVEPLVQRAGQHTVNALWATWTRLGIPRHQQVDNAMLFYGSPTHPRGMGLLIRLCLPLGIEPWFIPIGEPWRNGVVEKFNDHWRQRFLRRTAMGSLTELQRESLRFEQRHNAHYRYSKLAGKTPLAAMQASGVSLRLPPSPRPPQVPLPKPRSGRYHLIRFIRSDGQLDVFGEKFALPSQTLYEYVRATVDVERQCLGVYLDDQLLDEHPYPLHRR